MPYKSNNSASSSNLKTFFYLITSIFTYYEFHWIVQVFPELPFYKRILFLTMFSLFCNLFFFSLKFIMSFKENILSRKQEIKFFKFNFCISFLVFVLYWGMIIFNRDGVLPKDKFIPPVLDFLIHGGNFLANLFSHIMLLNHDQEKRNISWIFNLGFSFSFSSFYKIIYFLTGYSVYPLVAIMDLKIFIFLSLVAGILLILGEFIYLKIITFRQNKQINEMKNE